jgi:L-2-hydroxyglutarate oxidase LhgO
MDFTLRKWGPISSHKYASQLQDSFVASNVSIIVNDELERIWKEPDKNCYMEAKENSWEKSFGIR